MSPRPKVEAHLEGALDVFIEELDSKHLPFFEAWLKSLDGLSGEVLLEQLIVQQKEAENHFHLIKGGASFLKIPELAEPAIAGEELMKGEITEALPPQLQQIVEEIKNAYQEILK